MVDKHKDHKKHESHEKSHEHKHSKKVEPLRREESSNINFWMVLSVFLAFLLLLSILTSGFKDLSLFSGVEVTNSGSLQDQQFSVDGDYVLGSKDARVTIIEFSDLECPFCGRFHEQTFPSLKEKYIDTGKVNFIYKHFPLSFHKQALPTAIAAECAGEQGKFYEMIDLLFNKKEEWAPLSDLTEKLVSYAKSLDLDETKFRACLNSKDVKNKIQKDFNEGQSRGVSGTPAFFIGNDEQGYIKISGAQPLSVFEDAINKILSGVEVKDSSGIPKDPEKVFVTEDSKTDGILGSENASIVMFEYSDFQCPFCRKFFFDTLPSIKSNFIDTGKLRLVYKDFPLESLGHVMASPSAQAALCAKEQGDEYFWKVHDKLYEKQNELNSRGTAQFNKEDLYSWLKEIEGLDVDKVISCVESEKYKDAVNSDFSEGQKNGIRGTPSFIILFNGDVDENKLVGLQVSDGRGDYYVRYVVDQNGRKGLRVVGAQPYSYFEKYLTVFE